jgi:hypothetical protein
VQPDPGSWRDPTSRVLRDDGRVVRLLDATAAADFEALASTTFFTEALAEGRIVATRRLDEPPAGTDPEWVVALEHALVPVISYPFEWTFSMLRDAALLQLDLTEQALREEMITKDATPYNVQFVGAAPVFIDVGSFERLTPGEPWFGYRQFCELFLNPLLLGAAGVAWRPWLRGSTRGITPAQTRDVLPLRRRARPSVFTHVGAHAWAQRRFAGSSRDVRGELRAAGFGPGIVAAQVRRLRKLVHRLHWRPTETAWSGYADRAHYDDDDLVAKTTFVAKVAARRHRTQVLDLGANDGRFTEVAASSADCAVAVDGDDVAVDRLYTALRERGEHRILPLCVDLGDPTGPFGWRARERAGFLARVKPDLVLFLAVIHHLAITDSIPLEEIIAMLAAFDADTVVELPTPEDPMVRRLGAQKKERRPPRYDIETFETALGAGGFEVAERVALPSGTRLLYDLRRRA